MVLEAGRDRYARQSLGASLDNIKECKTLLVGAGGIGCELLKNLALTGFGHIQVVDLDTIDLSNLNRQFLFRHEHIKKSKALVAKDSASKFNPRVKIEAYHANIKDPQFNVNWFRGFDVVFNALDNLDARRYVNKMCLAASVPLIESGTTGFNGQVQVIIKGQTECYDCNTKEVPKTFPVCTIRSTPSQPIHCIVWAKSYLFTEIFGVSEDEAPELDQTEDSENAKEIENLRQEAQALQTIRASMNSEEFPRLIFEKVFKDDIERLRGMEDMWKTRKAPNALDYDTLSKAATQLNATQPNASPAAQGQRPWSDLENFSVFCDSLGRLSERLKSTSNGHNNSVLSFDKDDEDVMDFVTATANLRAIIFGIEPKSKFESKQMAGNIIPAIATTNAMVAGLCVLQAFKIMRNDIQKARNIFLEPGNTRQIINTETLRLPNPDCAVCSVTNSSLIVDLGRATLRDLVEDVVQKQLGYSTEVTINSEIGTVYDPDLEDNLVKKLTDLGIRNDSFLTIIDDEEEDPRVNLSLAVSESATADDTPPISLLIQDLDIPRKPKLIAPISLTNGATNGHTNGDETVPASAEKKRKRSEGDVDDVVISTAKKGKLDVDQQAVVTIDDGPDGAYIIDD